MTERAAGAVAAAAGVVDVEQSLPTGLGARERALALATLQNFPPAPRQLPPRLLAGDDDGVRRMAAFGATGLAIACVLFALFAPVATVPFVIGALAAAAVAGAMHLQPRLRARRLAFVRDGIGVVGAVDSIYEKIIESPDGEDVRKEWRVSFRYRVAGASFGGDERISDGDKRELETANVVPLVVDARAPSRYAVYMSALDAR